MRILDSRDLSIPLLIFTPNEFLALDHRCSRLFVVRNLSHTETFSETNEVCFCLDMHRPLLFLFRIHEIVYKIQIDL